MQDFLRRLRGSGAGVPVLHELNRASFLYFYIALFVGGWTVSTTSFITGKAVTQGALRAHAVAESGTSRTELVESRLFPRWRAMLHDA